MIYFIVNNDFHVDHIEYYTKQLNHEDMTIIRIPYALNKDCLNITENVMTFHTPFRRTGLIKRIYSSYRIKKRIKKTLIFNEKDKIVLLTEYDPLTQYIVYLAKEKRAITILLQEGISTYCTNVLANKSKFSLWEKMKLITFKKLYGFSYFKQVKYGARIFPQMDDVYIDKIILYFNMRSDRDIEKIVLNSPYERLENLDARVALFLNQPIYGLYLSQEKYFDILNSEILEILNNFKKVIFKFHPHDQEDIKKKIRLLFIEKNIVFSEGHLTLEETMKNYKPLNVFSFFSDSLLRLKLQGCNVHYLFTEHKELVEDPILKNIQSFIENKDGEKINYHSSVIEVLNED